MDLALEVPSITTWAPDKFRFQSLFSWIWLSKSLRFLLHKVRIRVSILVFVDLALEVSILIYDIRYLMMFQSLFSWIWLSKKIINMETTRCISDVSILVFVDLALEVSGINRRFFGIGCFNPCFRGSGSRRSISAWGINSPLISFQSLFSWIWLSKHEPWIHIVSTIGVSILVFVDLALEAG